MRRFVLITLLLFGLMPLANAAELLKVRDPVPGSYVVVLKADAGGIRLPLIGGLVNDLVKTVGGTLQATFDSALNGFSIQVNSAQLAQLLKDPRVAYVEQNARVKFAQNRQANASWGLDRIDQRSLPLDEVFSFAGAGAGAHIYIIDSGLRRDHREFSGRVGNGVSTVRDNRGVNDCGGHGTAVAGVAAGASFGVAKRAIVHPVRVVNCEGFSTSADIIAGIDWIVQNQQRPAVVNISLGSFSSRSTMQAVRNATAQGLLFAVAAGNQSADACGFSPGNTDVALTVGASTRNDQRASFSNAGSCVDLFAPGENITSAWNDSASASQRLSGTSFAAPYAAGVAAVYRAGHAGASPGQVSAALLRGASSGQLGGIGSGSPNRLLYSRLGAAPPASANTPSQPSAPPAQTPAPSQPKPAPEPERREPPPSQGLCDLPLLGGLCR